MVSTRRLPVLLAVVIVGLAGVLAAACGGATNAEPADTEPMHQEESDHQDEAVHEEEGDHHDEAVHEEEGDHHDEAMLHVVLTEWAVTGEGDAALPTLTAGEAAIEVHNDGAAFHNLIVIRTDRDAADLPVADSAVDEAEAGEVVARTADLEAGGMEMLTADLESGTYALICNVVGHYERGMFAQLTVE